MRVRSRSIDHSVRRPRARRRTGAAARAVTALAASALLSAAAGRPAGAGPAVAASPVQASVVSQRSGHVAAACPARGRYRPPVNAPVRDPFRLPDGPFRAGNRGIEYATVAGAAVRAIGAGEVTFAGSIAGWWYVTVRHTDGLRSSYAFLAAVTVEAGAEVGVGQILGTAGERGVHLGVRRGDLYVDPAPLLGPRYRAWLVVPDRFGDGGGCR